MIHPFRAWRPTAAAGPYQDLVTLPYDKITAADLPGLRARSPYCAVHLIRGESGPGDGTWYATAAARLAVWKKSGVLAPDAEASYYALRQRWTSSDGRTVERVALVGALDLSERARVLPHEKTHARAREDRFHLLKATECHFGLVFLVRPGAPKLRSYLEGATELGQVRGLEGADHTFLRIEDEDARAALRADFAVGDYVIADGHHRFATACRFADENPHAKRVLVGVVEESDPGLRILPTHRLLYGLEADAVRELVQSLPDLERVDLGDRPDEEIARLGPGSIGMVLGSGESFVWRNPRVSEVGVLGLDVRRLEEVVQNRLLVGREVEDHLSYWREAAPALRQVRSGRANLLALVAPILATKVVEVARRRETMPQKSTDFYPKLPTGFGYLPAVD